MLTGLLALRTKFLLNILFSLNCEKFYGIIPHKSFSSYTVKCYTLNTKYFACELKIKNQDPVKPFNCFGTGVGVKLYKQKAERQEFPWPSRMEQTKPKGGPAFTAR